MIPSGSSAESGREGFSSASGTYTVYSTVLSAMLPAAKPRPSAGPDS